MKRFSDLTLKIKLWAARKFGFHFYHTGKLEEFKYTFGGAGNQWTKIDGIIYATYWDVFTKDWDLGDDVRFELFYQPLNNPGYPVPQAKNIKKIGNSSGDKKEPLFV